MVFISRVVDTEKGSRLHEIVTSENPEGRCISKVCPIELSTNSQHAKPTMGLTPQELLRISTSETPIHTTYNTYVTAQKEGRYMGTKQIRCLNNILNNIVKTGNVRTKPIGVKLRLGSPRIVYPGASNVAVSISTTNPLEMESARKYLQQNWKVL